MLEINDFGPGSIEDKNTEEIAQIFFLLNQEHKELLSDEKILTEIHRRVSVFFDALEDSGGVYDVFEAAYKNTLYSLEKNKQQYLQGIAQGFISLLLFGNDEHKIEPNQDIDYINSRIEGLFRDISSPFADEIKNMLQYMIKKGYPQQNINRLGLMNEIKTPISTLFDIIDGIRVHNLYKIDYGDCNSIIFDLCTIRKKFLEITHMLYTQEDRECYCGGNRIVYKYGKYKDLDLDIDPAGLALLLTKTIDILSQLEQIKLNELALMSILSNDNVDKKDDNIGKLFRNIGKLFRQHISNYSLHWKYESVNNFNGNPRYYTINNKNLHNHHMDCDSDIVYFINNVEFPAPLFGQILEKYLRHIKLKFFDAYVGRPDYLQIEQDKLQFGAKGAYMNAMKIFVEKFHAYKNIRGKRKLSLHDYDTINVPQYENIPTEYYDTRKSTGKLTIPYFKQLFQERKAKNIYVIGRSSAKNSEDNDVNTGAGIYHSEIIYHKEYAKKNFTFKNFCNVIEKIYRSCESERAVKYRREQGIEDESMGITIQEFVDGCEFGHINSILPHRPELLEVTSGAHPGFRSVINREKLMASLFEGFDDFNQQSIFHYDLDESKRGYDMIQWSRKISGIGFLLERYFGKPVQIEYVITRGDFFSNDKTYYHIVQVRPLPIDRKKEYEIDFPEDMEQLREGRAMGSCDKVLDVLPTGDDNSEKVGAVIFSDNWFFSLKEDDKNKIFPKDGAVIIMGNIGLNGHIETLSIGKGIICLFPLGVNIKTKKEKSIHNLLNGNFGSRQKKSEIIYLDFKGYKKIRVVANGLEGRIYGIDEPQTK